MSDVMAWWQYMDAVRWNFNRYAWGLGTIQSDMSPLKIKEKATRSMPLHQTCQLKLWNFSRQDYCYVVNARSSETPWLCHCSCNKYVFWPSVTSTNTTAVQTCLLVEWCARWVLARPLPLNQYACRSFTTQSVCLSIFYHSFLYASWCSASLSAIPACMVSHYQPCLLYWSLIICHAFWCDVSLSTMPIGVVTHYRPCLLVSCHCNRHF